MTAKDYSKVFAQLDAKPAKKAKYEKDNAQTAKIYDIGL